MGADGSIMDVEEPCKLSLCQWREAFHQSHQKGYEETETEDYRMSVPNLCQWYMFQKNKSYRRTLDHNRLHGRVHMLDQTR